VELELLDVERHVGAKVACIPCLVGVRTRRQLAWAEVDKPDGFELIR
jgi:hypothetical protein